VATDADLATAGLSMIQFELGRVTVD